MVVRQRSASISYSPLPTGVRFREFSIMLSDAIVTSAVQSINAINYAPSQRAHFATGGTDVSCMTSNTLAAPGSNPAVQIGETENTDLQGESRRPGALPHHAPARHRNSEVFTIHGHTWQRNPYQNRSTVIAFNNLSQWMGSRDNHGSGDHFDLVIPKAGGTFNRAGDYLYTAYLPGRIGGIVGDPAGNPPTPNRFAPLGQVRKPRLRQDRRFRI